MFESEVCYQLESRSHHRNESQVHVQLVEEGSSNVASEIQRCDTPSMRMREYRDGDVSTYMV